MRSPDDGAPEATAARLAKLEATFEHALDAIFIGVGEILTDANPAACALVKLPREQVVGRKFSDFHRPEDLERVARLFAETLAVGRAQGTIDVVRGDGSVIHAEYSFAADILPGVHLSILRDVTARRQRELMSERYELLSRHARDIVLFVDRSGTILEANDAATAVYGYPHEELVGMNVRTLRAPSTHDLIPAQMEEAFARGILLETLHVRRDGRSFPAEVSSRATLIGSERVLLSIVRDVTERVEMQANLLNADRLAAVGTLAAGVAHEINNPLGYATGNLDMMARRLPEAVAALAAESAGVAAADPGLAARLAAIGRVLAESEEMLAVAREGTDRVRSIVLDLKRFSRSDEALVGPVDVHDPLDYALGVAVHELRHRARLVRAYGDVPFVVVNESRLGQVFLNLIVNASQAIPEGRPDEHVVTVRTTTDTKGRVVIEVSDTGIGIPPHLLGRVFDPFVTTKPAGEGTGLGLYVSRSIVKEAGGEITIESEVGRGTTVRVALPAAPTGLTPPLGTAATPRSRR